MKISETRFLSLFAVLLGLWATPAPGAVAPVPAPPKIDAKAHLLIDFNTAQVLAEGNIDERLEPASLTKIMTLYTLAHEITEGRLALDDLVTVSEKAWKMGGSRMFIEVGKQVPVHDLLLGVVIQSGNDAGVALAEHVSGAEEVFAELMNQHAERLGLKNSHFVNTSGLPDPEHYTTARDLATLAAALIRDYPEQYALSKMQEFTFNGIKQRNRNKLLWRDPSVDGIKTGHTAVAGYCLVASAVRDGMRLISVILGSASEKQRTADTQALLNYGFRFYETRRLYGANKPLTEVRVWKGEPRAAGLGLTQDLYITLPRRQHEELNATMNVDGPMVAPVVRGQRGGTLKITLGGEAYTEKPLVALSAIPEGSLFSRLVDEAWMLWDSFSL